MNCSAAQGDNSPQPFCYGATSSYVGNAGYYETIHPTTPFPSEADPSVTTFGRRPGFNNGVLYVSSYVRNADITDGASQTIMVGERAWFQGSATWVGTPNIGSPHPAGSAWCLGRVFWRINAIPDPPGVLITPNSSHQLTDPFTARSAFGSYHPGGANFLFADGSVRILSENIDHRVTTEATFGPSDPFPDQELLGTFQRLGIRNDGLVINGF